MEVSFSFTIYIISHIYLYSILFFKRHAFPKHYVIDGRLYRKKNEENQGRKSQCHNIKEGRELKNYFHISLIRDLSFIGQLLNQEHTAVRGRAETGN